MHIDHTYLTTKLRWVFQTDFGTILGVYTRFDKIYAFFVTGAQLKMELSIEKGLTSLLDYIISHIHGYIE